MITIDYLISDHKGAGRRALQTICDFADLTGQVVFLNVDSHLPSFGIEGSPEKDAALIEWYKEFGFEMSSRPYEWEGVIYTDQNMERQPNVSSATVRLR
jgi:hypothetical protein